MMRSVNSDKIIRNLPAAVFILLAIQPLLDVAGYWQAYFGFGNAFTLAVRVLLFGGTILVGVWLAEKRTWYIGLGCVFMLHTALHYMACSLRPGGYAQPVTDIINLVRIWYLPVMTVCFITFLKNNPRVLPAMARGFLVALMEIAAVMVISVITATNPYTYSMYYIGVLGWFLWTNCQSAILSMLSPVAILYTAGRRRHKTLKVAVVTAIAEAALYYLGTRLAFASMIANGLAAAVALCLTSRSRKKTALVITCITILFAAAYPLSPANERVGYVYMGYYREWVAQREAAEQAAEQQAALEEAVEIPDTIPADPATDGAEGAASEAPATSPVDPTAEGAEGAPAATAEGPAEETTDGAVVETTDGTGAEAAAPPIMEGPDEAYLDYLEELYRSRHLMWSLVERFGRDKAFEAFEYAEDLEKISNVRRIKITYCDLLMEEAGWPARLFGLSLQDMTFLRYDADYQPVIDNYDVENDFHGLYYLTGITGLILLLLFLAAFPVMALSKVIRRPKEYLTPLMAAFGIAFGIAMIHAVFTASILRHNNASIYLAVILAALWHLSQDRKEVS